MPWLVFIIALLFFVPAAEARTALSLNTYGQPLTVDLQGLVDEAQLPTPEALVSVQFAPCPGRPEVAGCFVNDQIWIHQRYLGQPQAAVKILFHELGHVLDNRYLSAKDRTNWARALGFKARTRWTAPTGPSEWFAELAATCWLGAAKPYSTYRYPFTFQESAPGCQALENLLAGRSWQAPKLVQGRTVTRVINRHRPRLVWAGGPIRIRVRGATVEAFSCRGLIRYARDQRLRFDLCGPRIQITKSFSQPVTITYRSLPEKG